MIWTLLRILAALGAALLLYLVGAALVRYFASEPPPEKPDPATLEDVDYRYECIVCGAQAVLYAAPGGEVPEAPRHCREPMTLITPTS